MTDKTANDSAPDAVLGWPVPGWRGATPPEPCAADGRYCRIEPFSMAHASQLHEAYDVDGGAVNWNYLPYGPFDTVECFKAFLEKTCLGKDPISTPSSTPHPADRPAWRATCGSILRKV